ncbi:cytochrome b [Caballeronia sp. GAWG2-1]|uniref:cytochrome b n=1 Tax=Caballeronia sp. GAWG2-1 TaxID=2921744 RepID=UPI002027BB65|nr:cytochrome b [Caballeronia sp. GAWG2-1]
MYTTSHERTQETARASYDRLSIAIHWFLFVCVVALCIIGFLFYKLDFNSESYNNYYYWHRSVGEVVFAVMVFSVFWRSRRPRPPELRDVQWRARAAKLTQRTLIGFLIAVPAIKIWRGAYGIGWEFFGIKIPAPLPKNVPMGHFLTDAHYYTAIALIALSSLHALAALYHHYFLKDKLINRMNPF